MVKSIVFSAVTACYLASNSVSAFTTTSSASSTVVRSTSSSTSLHATPNSRRELFLRTGSTLTTALLTTFATSSPAFAATTPPTAEEIERIKTGYQNIKFLLENWEKETTVCRENGGECKRDADAVRRYLGLRSTTDPLFQIEKVCAKGRFMPDLDPDKLDAFFEATEEWWEWYIYCNVGRI